MWSNYKMKNKSCSLWDVLDIFSSFWIWKRSNLQLMNIEMLLEVNQHIKRSLNQASHNGYHKYKEYFYWQTEVCLIVIYLRVDSQRNQVACVLFTWRYLSLMTFDWLIQLIWNVISNQNTDISNMLLPDAFL